MYVYEYVCVGVYACVSDLDNYLYACVNVCVYALMPGCLGVYTCAFWKYLISRCLDSMCVKGQMHVHVAMGVSTYMYVYVYVLHIHKNSYKYPFQNLNLIEKQKSLYLIR